MNNNSPDSHDAYIFSGVPSPGTLVIPVIPNPEEKQDTNNETPTANLTPKLASAITPSEEFYLLHGRTLKPLPSYVRAYLMIPVRLLSIHLFCSGNLQEKKLTTSLKLPISERRLFRERRSLMFPRCHTQINGQLKHVKNGYPIIHFQVWTRIMRSSRIQLHIALKLLIWPKTRKNMNKVFFWRVVAIGQVYIQSFE
jgi:hypothetical protein